MNKVILFLWFGDEKPPYVRWTLENFRRMNPGWEIRYIEYSTEQIQDYRRQRDRVLAAAVERNSRGHVNFVADEYRKIYLGEHRDELVIYCDLDCFPIAPFDDFVLPEGAAVPEWVRLNHPNEHVAARLLGSNWFRAGGYAELRPDIWCMCNNRSVLFDRFLQLKKGSVMDETLVIHNAMLMNESAIPEFRRRSLDFHQMKIPFGDSFCLPRFTPVEHYYSFERNRLNPAPIPRR